MAYLYLFGAIVCEVIGTMLLTVSDNFKKPLPTFTLTIVYILAFYFLTYAMKGIPIAIVYATWSGLGIFFYINPWLLNLWTNFTVAISSRITINYCWYNYSQYISSKNHH